MLKSGNQSFKFIETPFKYWWLFVVFFMVVGVFLGLNNTLYFSYIEKNASVFELMWPEVMDWFIWGLFCPFIIWLAKTYPKDKSTWGSILKFHLPLGIIVAFLYASLYAVLRHYFGLFLHEEFLWSISRNFMQRLYYFQVPIILYSSIVGITYAVNYYQQFKDEALKTAEIQQKLSQAELLVLKKQLHPHFLFNTLHTISSLMHKDLDAADKMISRLGNLLRTSLENTGVQEVTLEKEMEILQAYLEIEQIRFQDRMEVHTHIDPAIYDKKVPNLILQPIVENAIRYGVAPYAKKGKITVIANQVKDHIELLVSDNGKGLESTEPKDIKEGVGLKNTRMRLKQLYGERGKMILNNLGHEEGLEVKMLIPV